VSLEHDEISTPAVSRMAADAVDHIVRYLG